MCPTPCRTRMPTSVSGTGFCSGSETGMWRLIALAVVGLGWKWIAAWENVQMSRIVVLTHAAEDAMDEDDDGGCVSCVGDGACMCPDCTGRWDGDLEDGIGYRWHRHEGHDAD